MRRRYLLASLVVLASVHVSHAAPVPLSGYDIGDAVLSGHGGWTHTYTGTITGGASFVHNALPGTLATYSGVGGGTLIDGVIGASIADTQLFVPAPGATDATSIDPFIGFTLPFAYSIDTINIFGGDIPTNGIPGAITSVTVELLKTDFTTVSETFSTVPFGAMISSLGVPVNDRISLTGSSLDGVPAFAVTLFGFVTPGAGGGIPGTEGGWFSITEVEMDGTLFVPEPSTALLLMLGAAGLSLRRRFTV